MRDLIQRDPRELYLEDVCRHCGEPAMACDCDGFSTRCLVAPVSYDAREAPPGVR